MRKALVRSMQVRGIRFVRAARNLGIDQVVNRAMHSKYCCAPSLNIQSEDKYEAIYPAKVFPFIVDRFLCTCLR